MIKSATNRKSISWAGILVLTMTATAGLCSAASGVSAETAEVAKAKYLWAQSPHGRMLERILPPSVSPAELPEPQSDGARLVARYCVQCHYLPNPQMHTAARWAPIVKRMVWRMQGKGNLGPVMKEMMADVAAPSAEEEESLAAYLQRHGQREIDPAHPALRSEAGQMFSIACSQCHALPDPQRHTAEEWPAVVERMRGHMAWANTVVGARELRTNPELQTDQIIALLQRYARKPRTAEQVTR